MCHESRCSVIFELDTDTGSLSVLLEVKTHLRLGTKEDLFPRANRVVAVVAVEAEGVRGFIFTESGETLGWLDSNSSL